MTSFGSKEGQQNKHLSTFPMLPIFSQCLLYAEQNLKVNKTDEGSTLMSLLTNKLTKRIILGSDKYYEENKWREISVKEGSQIGSRPI